MTDQFVDRAASRSCKTLVRAYETKHAIEERAKDRFLLELQSGADFATAARIARGELSRAMASDAAYASQLRGDRLRTERNSFSAKSKREGDSARKARARDTAHDIRAREIRALHHDDRTREAVLQRLADRDSILMEFPDGQIPKKARNRLRAIEHGLLADPSMREFIMMEISRQRSREWLALSQARSARRIVLGPRHDTRHGETPRERVDRDNAIVMAHRIDRDLAMLAKIGEAGRSIACELIDAASWAAPYLPAENVLAWASAFEV